jgi:hypothetical protein
MGIYETYSKRLRKRERAGQPDVYQYDDLPETLRVQVVYILQDMFGHNFKPWQFIHNTLARELGVFNLSEPAGAADEAKCIAYLRNASTLQALDFIEMAFRLVSKLHDVVDHSFIASRPQTPDAAIRELNHRFKAHGVGYQFEGGEIVRVDSQYVHAEAVKPALLLLNTAGFEGASEEFFDAHKHYRQREYADAIADALKAFESTMKAICDSHGWGYREGDTAKTLIKTVLDNGLVPKYMETHLAGVRNTLGAGLPTVRNKLGGHGQGKEPRKVPDYFAGFALHLAATNIVFLVEAHQALNSK